MAAQWYPLLFFGSVFPCKVTSPQKVALVIIIVMSIFIIIIIIVFTIIIITIFSTVINILILIIIWATGTHPGFQRTRHPPGQDIYNYKNKSNKSTF